MKNKTIEIKEENSTSRRDFVKKSLITAAGIAFFDPLSTLIAAPGLIPKTVAEFKDIKGLDPFIGEIAIVAFDFAPRGWAKCDGQLLPILQNQALFSILGTTYGGNGTTNFALPDFQGRVPIHSGNEYSLGQSAGEISHTLIINEIPIHSHQMKCVNSLANSVLGNDLPASDARSSANYGSTASATMGEASISSVGGSQPHNNMQPYTVVNFIIAMQGIFPSRP